MTVDVAADVERVQTLTAALRRLAEAESPDREELVRLADRLPAAVRSLMVDIAVAIPGSLERMNLREEQTNG